MKENDNKAIIEGLLFASGDEGLTIKQISDILEIPKIQTEKIVNALSSDCEQFNRGIMLTQTKNVFHLTTKPEHGEYYKKMLESPHRTRLSQAALETLAIISYKQPITRLEIEEIRGVNSDRSVQTLQARSLVEEVGRKEAIGRPILFGTTKEFLFYFGLTSLTELPPLPESVNQEEVEHEADLFFNQLNEIEQNK